jgi:hypothetical protein
LKIKSVEHSIFENVLILDGDTFINSLFIVELLKNNHLASTKENVERYNNFIIKFLGLVINDNKSFFSNFSYIRKSLLIKRLGAVDDFFKGYFFY